MLIFLDKQLRRQASMQGNIEKFRKKEKLDKCFLKLFTYGPSISFEGEVFHIFLNSIKKIIKNHFKN